MGGGFDQEFTDEGVSGAIPAADRPGFAAMVATLRPGDTVYVYAIDRLGRDAIDVQLTVRKLLEAGVTLNVHGIGPIGEGAGEIILAVLAQVAAMERRRIAERTAAGRQAARASLEATGRTHRGKLSLGRPTAADPAQVAAWRKLNKASIAATAEQFGLSLATVKRYCGAAAFPLSYRSCAEPAPDQDATRRKLACNLSAAAP
jgi:putative DNA-invertase from lambdoid prophage Rac